MTSEPGMMEPFCPQAEAEAPAPTEQAPAEAPDTEAKERSGRNGMWKGKILSEFLTLY